MKKMDSADAAIIVLREAASGFQERDREIKVKHFSSAAPVCAQDSEAKNYREVG
ncbi:MULTISPECIES: hypothetical protein [Rhizobium]|uniref:hypothetical protein n=1 Tax=Rhizobium TaxID=379 RepID=UPI0023603A82|nr:hypothetical protein [Rhizobium sp. MC62]MDC9808587.1 hypothetical protein [Rhizobium sp. MC62]